LIRATLKSSVFEEGKREMARIMLADETDLTLMGAKAALAEHRLRDHRLLCDAG
jgi:hypothetical protein